MGEKLWESWQLFILWAVVGELELELLCVIPYDAQQLQHHCFNGPRLPCHPSNKHVSRTNFLKISPYLYGFLKAETISKALLSKVWIRSGLF
ncbi:hypothetical protein BYT27DRAFT_6896234 [Phlegmacium glaucopus]|nr:hypothetical protein BYT27DRAFT_6896234 [Phlegmacium glaucopus]